MVASGGSSPDELGELSLSSQLLEALAPGVGSAQLLSQLPLSPALEEPLPHPSPPDDPLSQPWLQSAPEDPPVQLHPDISMKK